MNEELKNLFDRYCHNVAANPKTPKDMEDLIQEFADVLKHDLTRAFYLKKLSDAQFEIPLPVRKLKKLVELLPSVKEPRLQRLKDTGQAILGEDVLAHLSADRQLYGLCESHFINDFQMNPSKETVKPLLENINVKDYRQTMSQVSEKSLMFDEQYHQGLSTLLNHIEVLQNKPALLQDNLGGTEQYQLNEHMKSLLYDIHVLGRRAEVGSELIHLIFQSDFSYLCYLSIMRTSGDEFDAQLKNSMMISQLDLLYEYRLLDQKLFIELRKKKVSAIQSELVQRSQVIDLLADLYQVQWIDANQVEMFLKSGYSQKAATLVSNLMTFKVKKEIQIPFRKKVKGLPNESELISQLLRLLKVHPDICGFNKEILKESESLAQYFENSTVEDFFNRLGEKIPLSQMPAVEIPVEQQTTPEVAKSHFKEVIKSHEKSSQSTAQPGAQGALAQEFGKLKNRLDQAVHVFEKLTDSKLSGQEALTQLGEQKLLFQETQQMFMQKLDMYRRSLLKDPKAVGLKPESPREFLPRCQADIEASINIDTKIFSLMETIKTYGEEYQLNSEELVELKEVDAPIAERECVVDLCAQKYQLVHDLYQQYPEDRLRELSLQNQPASLFHIFQDILRKNPFYFEGLSWKKINKDIPGADRQLIEIFRQLFKEIFEAAVPPPLFLRLIEWGIMMIEPSHQQKFRQSFVKALRRMPTDYNKLLPLANVPVSADNIKKILPYFIPQIEEALDVRGKEIVAKFRQVAESPEMLKLLNKSDIEYSIQSLIITQYIVKVRPIFEAIGSLEGMTLEPPSKGKAVTLTPRKVAQSYKGIMGMELCDDRLELLLEEVYSLLGDKHPLVIEGQQMYHELTGFEF
ncbi:hypothetical protein WDW89_08945 [Deltaproteobacteria bacterium TL4]